MEMLLTQA
uniref:Uncharacterized protein n=1 Tax=Rhizophora mucronata TaxID=61149 RepID=A0A2P2NXW9_RHIMU